MSSEKRWICIECERRMRNFGQKAADHPGTIARSSLTTCISCRAKQTQKARRSVPATVAAIPTTGRSKPITDEPCVLVRSDIRPSTFVVLHGHARRLGITEGELLSRLADRAVGSKP